MKWEEWAPLYAIIVSRLALDTDADRRATAVLSEILAKTDPYPLLAKLGQCIAGKDVIVCGAGPSLEEHLVESLSQETLDKSVVIAADGAASALIDLDVSCQVLVSDLDGSIQSIKEILGRGAIGVIHAHGDNLDIIKDVVPKLGPVLGSTQVEPTDRVFLWGGFTDGDRACYLAAHYNPRSILLAGMDFGDSVGRWSKPGHQTSFPASERKKTKLDIAKWLIEDLEKSLQIAISHVVSTY